MSDPETRNRAAQRDSGFRRLRSLTGTTVAVTVALAGAFTAVAARSFSGHKHAQTVVPPRVRRPAPKPASGTIPPPPALPADSASAQPVTPLAPASAPQPAPAQQQPVVVSGGS